MKTVRQIVGFAVISLHLSFATAPPVTGSVPEHLRSQLAKIQSEYSTGYWAERFAQRADMLNKGLLEMTAAIVDTVNAPVLMGRYSNSVGVHSAQVFQQLLFDGPNPTGTMTDYYLENSYGKLYMTGNCYGWFPTPRSFDYYVHDGGTLNAGLMYGGPDFTIDLLVEADKTVDFSKYVKYVDGEGAHVPQLAIIHTGSDAAAGGDNIWSHRWNIRWRLLDRKSKGSDPYFDLSKVTAAGRYIANDTYNGLPVIIDGDYAIQPEFAGSSNSSGSPKPIGVFTHEFGHIFGLPDLYDTDNSSAGLGNWCLMAGGSYGGDGSHEATPAHMSAWCKTTLNWVTPVTVTTYMKQRQIKNVNRHPEIYRINVRNNPSGQYFLVENRQKIGFDNYLLGSGLLIYHIDPSISGNSNENRRKVDLEQADGLRHLNVTTGRGDNGDPFPGATNNRNFDGYTNPHSRDYDLLQSYVGVRSISDSDTIMFADLDVGTRPYIRITSISAKESNSGNGNGRIDPGESGDIELKFENVYPVALTDAAASIRSTDTDVTFDTTAKSIAIPSLGTATITLPSSMTVVDTADLRRSSFTVSFKSSTQEFSVPYQYFIGYPKLLLINLDSIVTDSIAGYYEKILAGREKYYETVVKSPSLLATAHMPLRDEIILISGRAAWNIISDSIGSQLLSFVGSGGNLFMSGQNIAEDATKRNSPYKTSLLRAGWSKNILFGRTLYGKGEDHIGAQLPLLNVAGGNGAKNQTSPDELTVDTTMAVPSFIWNSTAGTAYGGVWWVHETGGGKVAFWSFGLEAINDSAVGGKSREQALMTVLNWFSGISGTPDMSTDINTPKAFVLSSNYPNPFNPSTTISYSIPVASNVTLTVYDMLGKKIATLVNGKQDAGVHSVTFSAMDASRLASGIYLYRLQAGNFVQTKKMTLLK